MGPKHLVATLAGSDTAESLRIAYLDQHSLANETKGIILLLHGFPQTSYQFRHVLPLLAAEGHRCIAPDYRGAGNSSKPSSNDFRKSTMAADMIALLDHLDIKEPVHIVGHDIGGMIAFAMASRYPERVRSVIWGECPLPGTTAYYSDRTKDAVQQFHFIFHSVPNLPEALVTGKERLYVSHFLQKITYNLDAFSEDDLDYYAGAYSQPGAMRCAFGVYRAFEEDSKENKDWVAKNGKCRIPTMVLSGEKSRHREAAEEMACEVMEKQSVEVGIVEESAHYLAEENPEGFARVVEEFVARH